MKKSMLNVFSITGFLIMCTLDVPAGTVLSKISTMVIIFSSVAGAAVWIWALKKRRELDE